MDKTVHIQNMTNEKQLPEKLYRDDLLRSAKAVKQWSIEQILEEAKKNWFAYQLWHSSKGC